MTSSMWDTSPATYLRDAPGRSPIGNELDDLMAMEERWAILGGPMTFSEYEIWERGEIERLAYEQESGRVLAERTTIVHPGQIIWLAPGEEYLPLRNYPGPSSSMSPVYFFGTDSTGPR